MIVHKLIYTLKILGRDKMLIFWTFVFPLLLGTFFMMAFADIEKGEVLDIIDIAIVDNEEWKGNENYQKVFQQLSQKDQNDCLFDIVYTSQKEAQQLLENQEISGYLQLSKQKPVIYIRSNGINETILKQVVDEIESQIQLVNTVAAVNVSRQESFDYEQFYQNIQDILHENIAFNNITHKNLSYTMIEFYSLIAMACLYGGLFVKKALLNELANMSSLGKRNAIAPLTKLKMILGCLLASYMIQLCGLLILYVYTIFVLNVDYGNHLPQIIVLSLAGSLAGLALGIGVSCLTRANENAKTVIMLAITMAGSFLSGMMGITMKYTVDTTFPVLNRINPVGMITDGLYALYYYDTFDRFYFDLVSLLIFSMIIIGISALVMRRTRYDSL